MTTWLFIMIYSVIFAGIGAWLDTGDMLNSTYGFATYGYVSGIIFMLILDKLTGN